MHYLKYYGRVRAILTYRVYQRYDNDARCAIINHYYPINLLNKFGFPNLFGTLYWMIKNNSPIFKNWE